MNTLSYVRHGQTDFNKKRVRCGGDSDIPLNPTGHQQAFNLGKTGYYQGKEFDVIVCSDLLRARQTAEHLALWTGYFAAGKEIIYDPLFRERHYGTLDGRPHTPEIREALKRGEAELDQFEGVEPMLTFQTRANKAAKYLVELDCETGLLVAHGTFGRALCRAMHNIPIQEMGVNDLQIPNAQFMEYDLASVDLSHI
jgi:probable phosphoglycerate mutase